MGNETSGFAVLNLSSYNMFIGLSMAATHYYENDVKHGEIFYRWPGAVHYTVFAQAPPDLSVWTFFQDVLGITDFGLEAPTAEEVDPALAEKIRYVHAQAPKADFYARMKGCYGGGSGTWLVLRGGLQHVNGEVTHTKLSLEEADPEYVLKNGKFTGYSKNKFYTTVKAVQHKDAGHGCHTTACMLPR